MEPAYIDLSPDEFRRIGALAVEAIASRLERIREEPARRWPPASVREALRAQPLPEEPRSVDEILADFERLVAPYPMGNESPRFFGWVNSTAAPLGVLADFLASGLNPSLAGGDHAPTYVEHAVLAWIKELVGWAGDAGAVLTSGGSAATIVAFAAMRDRATDGRVRARGMDQDSRAMTLYASTQVHSCVQKAVELLGFGSDRLHRSESDADGRLDVARLEERLRRDEAEGLRPVAVAASAGTVNAGAIDPLDELADLCERRGLWLHVDGAYGAAAAVSPKLRPHLRGVERADSLVLDPHKWMYQPIECGCALVRDAQRMRRALSVVPPYLQDASPLPWFSEFSIQQTRGFRALKLWFVLQQAGRRGLARAIEHDVEMADELRAAIRRHAELELVASGPLSIACFRYRPRRSAEPELVDRVNRALIQRIQERGRVFLTATELAGRPCLRACVVNFRTRVEDVEVLVDEVVAAGRACASEEASGRA